MKPFIFFDLGQTLIDEWDYINYFDKVLLSYLNGYGAKMDYRNYLALRNNLIRNRKFGTSSFLDIVSLIAQLVLPKGYSSIIHDNLISDLLANKKKLIKLFPETHSVIPLLSNKYSLGIISNNSSGSARLLIENKLDRYFEIVCLSENTGYKKPDHKIFEKALEGITNLEECIMVGDRLDIDILPANELGMKTIRTLNSLYKIQKPRNKKEHPMFNIYSLSELPDILHSIS